MKDHINNLAEFLEQGRISSISYVKPMSASGLEPWYINTLLVSK